MFDFLSDTELPFSDTDQDEGDALETARTLEKPLIRARKAKRREFIAGLKKEALNELIPTLPDVDTDLWIIGNGSGAEIRHGVNPLAFDFGSFIPHVCRMLGDQGVSCYISTWTLNEGHCKNLIEMLTDGRLSSLAIVIDPYFSRRTPAIYAQLITGLQAHGGRFKAFKCHTKIVALSNPAGDCCTIFSSANLSAQPRTENYTVSCAPDLYQWVRDEFFERMLTTNAKTNEGQ